MSRLRASLAILAILAGLAASSAIAGSYAVAPVTVRLTGARPIAEVAVENQGAAPLRLEARMFAWTQPGGEDALEATRDVIVFPPVFVLAPGETQTVRVAWRGPAAREERAFRLRLDELPGDIAPGTVAVMVRQILPVFFQPGPAQAPRIEGRVDALAKRVRLANTGATHVRAIAVRWFDNAGGLVAERQEPFYLLAGAERTIALPSWPADRHDARVLKIQSPHGEFVVDTR